MAQPQVSLNHAKRFEENAPSPLRDEGREDRRRRTSQIGRA